MLVCEANKQILIAGVICERHALAKAGEDVTFGQLRTFVCVARAGSFVKAADALGITQPAVSEQITGLEEKLGYLLFRRRRGTTPVLTEEGSEALEKAVDILRDVEALAGASPAPSRRSVVLNICIGPRLLDAYLKPLLPRIYREHPEMQIDSQPAVSFHEIGEALEKGRIDLAVYTVSSEAGGWTEKARTVCSVPTVLVGPPGTGARLASGEIALSSLKFLFPGAKETVQRWAESVLGELGVQPEVAPAYFQIADVAMQLVEEGQGVSVFMRESVEDRLRAGALEILDYELSPMQRIIGRSPHAPPEARIIEDYLSEELAKGTPG